jgi:hypothetical protein
MHKKSNNNETRIKMSELTIKLLLSESGNFLQFNI